MKVYGLKSCDTCRRALKDLRAAHPDLQVVDIRADGLELTDIERIVDAVGWEQALNRRSTTWRGLDAPDKQDLDTAKAIALIAAHPTLLKRPAVTDGQRVTVGWTDDAKRSWLGDTA